MLYHYQIGFPANMKAPRGVLALSYSEHARQASRSDRYGVINLPEYIHADVALLVEAEVSVVGRVEKAVYRIPLDYHRDLVIVVIPKSGVVKTVWVNSQRDKHRTLDRSKYGKP